MDTSTRDTEQDTQVEGSPVRVLGFTVCAVCVCRELAELCCFGSEFLLLVLWVIVNMVWVVVEREVGEAKGDEWKERQR